MSKTIRNERTDKKINAFRHPDHYTGFEGEGATPAVRKFNKMRTVRAFRRANKRYDPE